MYALRVMVTSVMPEDSREANGPKNVKKRERERTGEIWKVPRSKIHPLTTPSRLLTFQVRQMIFSHFCRFDDESTYRCHPCRPSRLTGIL